MEILEDSDFEGEEADVCIIPDNGWLTDEDSGDEDCTDPNRLNKNQLDAPASLFIRKEGETQVDVSNNHITDCA